MLNKYKKKGAVSLGELPAAALAIAVLVIILALSSIILVEFNDTEANANSTYIIGRGLIGLESFANWIPLIVIALVAGLILFIVLRVFGGIRSGV